LWRAQNCPKAVSSKDIAEDVVSEALVLAAAKKDVGDGLPPLPTAAVGTSDGRKASVEEETIESDVLGPQLH
jgi:hypothetical protein